MTGEPGSMIDVHPAEVCVCVFTWACECAKTTHVLDSKGKTEALWLLCSQWDGRGITVSLSCSLHTYCTHTHAQRVPENAVVGCTSKHHKDKMSLCVCAIQNE